MKKILMTLTLSVATLVHAEDMPGKTLLSYFQSNCRSSGEWTQLALSDSMALVETLRSISQDPDCKSLGGSIANLNLLSRQLQNLQNVSYTQSKISELNFQEQELMVQLSQTQDSSTQDQIGATLRDIQLTRAAYLSQEKTQKELSDPSKVQVMTDVVQIANSTYAQLASNQKCLSKNPGVLNSATSIMATVGATVAVVNPAIGLGLTAGAVVLGTTIEGVRNHKQSSDMRKIADYSSAYEGYKCALETMSSRWCQMKDAETFLEFKANERMKPIENAELSQAIRLNDREIPVLLEWLNKIRSGVTPATIADASRQSTVFARENTVRSHQAYGVGLIEENKVIYESLRDRNDRWNIIRTTVTTLIPSTGFTSSGQPLSNPFTDVLSPGYAPFFLLGLDDIPELQNQAQGGYHTLDTWPGKLTYVPNIERVKERFLQWVEKAQARVNQELTQVLQPDAEQTISSAYDRVGNRWKISPATSLKNIINFLEKNPPKENNKAFRKIYSSTLIKLRDIYDVTETYVATDGNPDAIMLVAKSSVEQIYEHAQLKYGTVVLQSRLDLIVRLSILEVLQTSSTADQTLVAQLLAAERFTETLSRMSGTDNLSVIRQDIQSAQPITISNLDSFADLFGKNITKILKKLYQDELSSSGTIAKAYKNQRTQMCFLLLSVPNVLDFVNVSYCDGTKLDALVSGGPTTKMLNINSYQTDLNDRACIYRDFYRQNKIYENWAIKSN